MSSIERESKFQKVLLFGSRIVYIPSMYCHGDNQGEAYWIREVSRQLDVSERAAAKLLVEYDHFSEEEALEKMANLRSQRQAFI